MTWLKQKDWSILTSGFRHSSTVQPVTIVLFWRCQPHYQLLLGAKQRILLIKERFRLAENLGVLAAHHLYFSKVFAARKKNLTTARARKNKITARVLANARKDHSIPLDSL